MKQKLLLLFLCFYCFTLFSLHAQPEITIALQDALEERSDEEFISVNLRLSAQYNDRLLYSQSRAITDVDERRQFVVSELKSFTDQSQAELLAWLRDMEADGMVRNIRPLWIGNLVNCEVRPSVVEALMARQDLARIDYNMERYVLMAEPGVTGLPEAETDRLRTPDNLAWNVTLVNAHQVWAEGYTGEGVIVAVLDTGVNYNHLDITDNMWEHPDYPNHGYNFVNNNHVTMDYQSHGTHCAGTVAGTGAAGTGTGIAPGATIMNLKVLGDTGSGTEAGVWAAIEFAVEYGAHVMSLSLGWQHAWGPDRSMWRTTMNNALSAGVIAAVAAGNEGSWGGQPPPSQVRTPGDVPPPWRHPDQTLQGGQSAVVSVGSTTSSDALSSFSSKGPVTWQNIAPYNDYPYNPGIGLIRPDITAPGSDILSLTHNSNTGYTVKSGTSMATPAVAGLMALILSKNPTLTPEEVNQIIEESAIPMTSGKSNTFGSGRIDALAAINQTPYMGISYVDHIIDDSEGNNDGIINPGEFIRLNIAFENPTDEDIHNVVLSLEVESPFITLVNDYHLVEVFPAETVLMFDDLFSFEVSDSLHGNHQIEFMLTTYPQHDLDDMWTGSFIETAHAAELVFSGIVVDDSEGGNNNGHLDPGETAVLTVTLTNEGQMGSTAGTAFLESDNHWIAVLSHAAQEIPALDPGQSIELSFEVAAFHEAPLESNVDLLFNAQTQSQAFAQLMHVIIGEAPYYDGGDIPSTLHYHVTTGSASVFPGQMTVTIPEGATITGVDVEYAITSRLGVNMSAQESFLRCVSPGGTTEPEVYSGSGNTTGTYEYSRQGLSIANNVQGGGDIHFQLHVFRNHGGFGSNTTYVFVPNETWKIIVYYELPEYEVTFVVENQYQELIEGAQVSVGKKTAHANEAGEAQLSLPQGTLYYSVSAEDHRSVFVQPFDVAPENNLIDILLQRVFKAAFNITGVDDVEVADAVITVNGDSYTAGQYVIGDLDNGTYEFSIEAPGYLTYNDVFDIEDADKELDIVLEPGEGSQLSFDITDAEGYSVEDAVITLNGVTYEPGEYVLSGLLPGEYEFTVSAMCYQPYHGTVIITGQNLYLEVELAGVTGDANGDNQVNVLDVIVTVAFFSGSSPETFCFQNADVNEDGIIDILDIIGMVNIFTRVNTSSGATGIIRR